MIPARDIVCKVNLGSLWEKARPLQLYIIPEQCTLLKLSLSYPFCVERVAELEKRLREEKGGTEAQDKLGRMDTTTFADSWILFLPDNWLS